MPATKRGRPCAAPWTWTNRYIQYWTFITGFLQGDLGQSIRVRQPVTERVKEQAANSIKLGLAAMALTVLLGVPLGVLSAVKRNSFQGSLAKVFAILGQSMPMFWMGIVLIQVFAGQLDLLPAAGTGGPAHYILPAFTLGVFLIAAVMRLVRSSMLEALDTEYIKLARVKGVPEWKVIWKHALRNSLVPVISFGGTYVAILLTGAILVETVFAWPGLGDLVYKGIIWRDFPIIQAVVLLTAVVVVASNFITDILYAYLNPRVRYE
jgi:peptide/nickel transport system permease protein